MKLGKLKIVLLPRWSDEYDKDEQQFDFVLCIDTVFS
jgi:hypothetical protein